MNEELLKKIKLSAGKNFESYVQKDLQTSAEHGNFCMEFVYILPQQLFHRLITSGKSVHEGIKDRAGQGLWIPVAWYLDCAEYVRSMRV